MGNDPPRGGFRQETDSAVQNNKNYCECSRQGWSGDLLAPRAATWCGRCAGRHRTRHNHRPTIGRLGGI